MASLDANSDGSIDIEEWCNNLPRAMYLKIQAALTDDGRLSTFLTLEEQLEGAKEAGNDADMAKLNLILAEKNAQFKRIFDRFDADGSGEISSAELAEALKRLPRPKKVKQGKKLPFDELFATLDSNGDGQISLSEFTDNMPMTLKASVDEAITLAIVYQWQ